MPENTVLIRDRKTKGILNIRLRHEPVKVRICRICSRAHAPGIKTCSAA